MKVTVDGLVLKDEEVEMLGRMVWWFASEELPDADDERVARVLLHLFGGACHTDPR